MQPFDMRIALALCDEKKQVLRNNISEEQILTTGNAVRVQTTKKQKQMSSSIVLKAKQETEYQWMESQRRRGREFRENTYTHEALKCHGYCPGERTLTNDWTFWNGHEEVTEEIMLGKSTVMSSAKHGHGCGGSLEWVKVIRERRSRMNRRIAEKKTTLQSQNAANEEVPQNMQSVELCTKRSARKYHMSRKSQSTRNSKKRPCMKKGIYRTEKLHCRNRLVRYSE